MNPRTLDWTAYLGARLGWAAGTGLLALAAAGLLHGAFTRPVLDEIPRLESETARLAGQPPAPAEPPARARLAQRLSGAADTPAAIARLFKAADAAGLSLDEGEYRLGGGQGTEPLRYQITLPLVGRYPALRDFLGQALNGDASLALDELRLGRKNVEETDLEATLRFSLYLRNGAAR